jgi:hypothetical protein
MFPLPIAPSITPMMKDDRRYTRPWSDQNEGRLKNLLAAACSSSVG